MNPAGGGAAPGSTGAGLVAVCACTCRRPDGLGRLLEGLQRQRFERTPEPPVVVVIVDNDPAGSAMARLGEARAWLRFPLIARHEPRPGLTFARNALLDVAPHDARRLAFLDDDEAPEPSWLEALMTTADATGAELVAGPVRPAFESSPPAWAVAGKFYELGPYAEGRPVATVSTNNALVDAVALRERGWRFHPAFNLTGGEDEHFFLRATAAGWRAVGSAGAVAVESVPSSRVSLRWLLRRHLRMGTTLATIDRIERGTLNALALRAIKGVGRAGRGAATFLASPLKLTPPGQGHRRAAAVRGMCDVAWGLGSLAGLSGWRLQEYAEISGRRSAGA